MFKSNKSLTIISLLILLLVIVSCNEITDEMEAPAPIPNAKNSPTPVPSGTADLINNNKITIKSIEGVKVLEIIPNGQINFSGKVLTKRQKNTEKVIYSIGGKDFVEVKTKDADGFKVRDLSGKLHWKIKLKDDKIKISDNEENANPFELKKKEDGSKIVQNGNEIGKVKYNSASKKLKVKDAENKEVFTATVGKNSTAFGILLLEQIPEDQRFVIISELLARNL